MPDHTENHTFQLFAENEKLWEHRTDFSSLDTKVEIRDLDSARSDYIPKDGAKFFATDTESIYLGDGSSWNESVSTGVDPQLNSIQVKDNTGEVFAREFNGAGLASKVENALNSLSNNSQGEGRVRVTPKKDGTPWTWDKDLSIDLIAQSGAHIDIDRNVRIEYPGSGWAITATGGSPGLQERQSSRLTLTGGIWIATGTSPTGWARIQDTFGTRLDPEYVEFRNGTNDAIGIVLENINQFNEGGRLSGTYVVDIGLEARPQSYLQSGTGSDSYHDTVIDQIHINAYNTGIHLRGEWQFSQMIKPAIFAKTDNVVCLKLGPGLYSGLTITSAKFEDPARTLTGTIGIQTINGYDGYHSPCLVNPKFEAIDTIGDWADWYHEMVMIDSRHGDINIRNVNESAVFTASSTGDVEVAGSTRHTSGTTGPSIETAENLAGKIGNHDGEIRMDDGTNTVARMTACIWDDTNRVWRPVNDPAIGSFT